VTAPDPVDLAADLDAEVAVRRVMVAYMRACDNHDADAVAELFHPDAVWIGTGEQLEGREEVRSTYRVACARLTFCVHYLTNEWIRVDGDTALARWCYFEPATNRGDLAVWTAGRYDHELIRCDGTWMFWRFGIRPVLASPYDQGWGETPQVELP
jgi:uncharacterized protein (TIGR02246 family)